MDENRLLAAILTLALNSRKDYPAIKLPDGRTAVQEIFKEYKEFIVYLQTEQQAREQQQH